MNANRYGLIVALLALVLPNQRANAAASLTIGSLPGYPGATVSLPVRLQKATNAMAAQFDVAFNSSKASGGEVLPSSLPSNYAVRSREIAPGVRRVLVYPRGNALLQSSSFGLSAMFTVAPGERVGSGPI